MSIKNETKKFSDNRHQTYQAYHAYITPQQEHVSHPAPQGTEGHPPSHLQNPYFYNWAPYYYPYYQGSSTTSHPYYFNYNDPNALFHYNNKNNHNNTQSKKRRFRFRKHKIGTLHFLTSEDGAQPLFVNILHLVSAVILIIAFPISLLSVGYIGPSAMTIACGPMAAIFSFWSVYITPCECYPNIEWLVKKTRVFSVTAIVFDAAGTFSTPLTLYGAQCPDHNDDMFTCEDEIATAKAISIISSCALVIHLFLCLLVRSNAYRLAESKFDVLDDDDELGDDVMLNPMNKFHVSNRALNEELMTRN